MHALASKWGVFVILLSLINCSFAQVCSSYQDCYDCVYNGCGWCDDSEVCLSLSLSGSCTNSSQCFKTSISYGAKCAGKSCSSYSNCNTCVYNGCGWCDTTGTCTPIHNDGSEPCGGTCPDNTQCLKNSIAYGAKCPTASCSVNTNCYSCVASGCGWCDITGQCLPTANDGSVPCVGNCTNQCYKNSIAYGAKCASVSCSNYTDCNACVNGGCGWCDITGQCLPTFNDGNEPCIDNCTDQCYKRSTAYGAKCSTRSCSNYTDCVDCANAGCGWCDSTQQCLPVFNNGSGPCQLNCPNNDQCWKTSTAYGAKCSTKSCTNYTNCVACANAGCGWCDTTQQCLPVFNNGSGPCQSGCPDNDQCWKTSTAYGAPCASQSCSLYKDCYDCVSSGCGWCASSQSCTPRDNANTESCGASCSNSSSCYKTSTSSSSMCNSYSCNSYNTCVSCMNQGSCTWCSSLNSCVEQGYEGLCADCDNPTPDVSQCPDCQAYGCSGNGTCLYSGACNCSTDYYGMYCQQYCYAPTTCSGNGTCLDTGFCSCNENYYGPSCSIYCNANVTCKNRGICGSDGQCECNQPYFSTNCSFYCDPNVNCSSHGYCSAQGCQCYSSFYGNDCGTYCYAPDTCNNNGNCDNTGKCQCQTGSGPNCKVSKGPTTAIIVTFVIVGPCLIVGGIFLYKWLQKRKRNYAYTPIASQQQQYDYDDSVNAQIGSNARITRLPVHLPEFTTVKQHFYDKWTKGDPEKVKIIGILTVSNEDAKMRYKRYQSQMDSKHAVNVQQMFHGTKFLCDLQKNTSLCSHADCAICCIANNGFKLNKSGTNISFARFGRGIYFAPNSSKANDYNEAPVRAMLLCNVAAGNEYESEENMQNLTSPPTGYHSVRGVVGTKLNYPELVVYHEHAILVTHIILYSVAP